MIGQLLQKGSGLFSGVGRFFTKGRAIKRWIQEQLRVEKVEVLVVLVLVH